MAATLNLIHQTKSPADKSYHICLCWSNKKSTKGGFFLLDSFINTREGWDMAVKYGTRSSEYQRAKSKWERRNRYRNTRLWPVRATV